VHSHESFIKNDTQVVTLTPFEQQAVAV